MAPVLNSYYGVQKIICYCYMAYWLFKQEPSNYSYSQLDVPGCPAIL
jgi:hypothetical protein